MAIKISNVEVINNNSKGLFNVVNPGTYTTAQRDALNPVTGDMIWNLDKAVLELYNGTEWQSITEDLSDQEMMITVWGAGGGGWKRKAGPEWGPPARAGCPGHSLIVRTSYKNLGLSKGDSLSLYVGGGGAQPGAGGSNGGHPGGGGSGSGGYGGGGGGMSSIYMNGDWNNGTRLLIAAGGAGGYGLLAFGNNAENTRSDNPSRGASPSGAGSGGPGVSGGGPGSPGGTFYGGNAGTHGSGGGAGFYGGGGGPGDGGAANGGAGGNGLSWVNQEYLSVDTSNDPASGPSVVSQELHSVKFSQMLRNFPAKYNNFNPPGSPSQYPWVNPSLSRYSRGAREPQSDSIPGQNASNPLYSAPYCGMANSGGNGQPGSIHIMVKGTVYSYTSVGPHSFTLP